MTDAGPTPPASPTSPTPAATGPAAGSSEAVKTAPSGSTQPTAAPPRTSGKPAKDGLGHTRTSSFWAAVVGLVVLLVLLAVFVLQNVQKVEVSYFGWEGRPPLAAALLIAAASGALIAVFAGTLRILQLRRRVRRAQRR
jgi:uncharacterized integral membrane protein